MRSVAQDVIVMKIELRARLNRLVSRHAHPLDPLPKQGRGSYVKERGPHGPLSKSLSPASRRSYTVKPQEPSKSRSPQIPAISSGLWVRYSVNCTIAAGRKLT